MSRLKDSLQFAPKNVPPTPDLPLWVVRTFPAAGEDSIVERLEAPVEITLKVTPTRARAGDIVTLRAHKFGDLLKAGMKPGEAAHKLKTTIKALMDKPQTQQVVKDLIEGYTFDAQVRKLLARALANKGMIEQASEGGDPKLLVDYLKLVNADSEVGITGAPQVNFTVGMDEALKNLLAKTPPLELPPPIEAETEDVNEVIPTEGLSEEAEN